VRHLLNTWAAIIALAWSAAASGVDLAGLPVPGASGQPLILLELGRKPPSGLARDPAIRVTVGEAGRHEGDASIQTGPDEVSSLHPGFGTWSAAFRFGLETRSVAERPYFFWARWRQGGDPEVCVQTFEVWAGPDASRLERRSTFQLKPKGWEYAWVAAEHPLALKAGDAVIEVRVSGAGHDAKVFDAFLLGPPKPLPALPATGTAEQPAVLLELGREPAWSSAEKNPAVQVRPGTLAAQDAADSAVTEKDEVQVLHKGFGAWGATFRFDLSPAIPPGIYSVFARYKSGGEVSQVAQSFRVQAGPDPQTLGTRSTFTLTNTAPWEYQWLKAESTVAVLPGDRVLQIENTGKADGAKVFDAFLLKPEAPLGGMSEAGARSRNRFLALVKTVSNPERRLYVLDGPGESDDILFRGLAADAARRFYDRLRVTYSIGPEAEAMARQLNLAALPAAVLVDDSYTVLGVLSRPGNEAEVPKFLADPVDRGAMPIVKAPETAAPAPLKNGVPETWLVGGLQDGPAGVSIYGLDTETVLRPNPGQPYFGTALMGGEFRTWQKAPASPEGVTVVEAETRHSYAWAGGSGYAQLYLHADRPTQARLRLRQSGTRTDGWLDGRPLAFADDPSPPAEHSGTAGFPKGAEPPRQAALDLSPGWHSLLVKLVMRHDQGQRFAFAARFTDPAGRPLNSITTSASDPDADLGLNAIAGKLRPLIHADAPANLPHPDDPLRLRADIRWHPLAEEQTLNTPLPAFKAMLRLRLVDYGGREIAVREVKGRFPGEVSVDFGKAPEAGYYAVYPALLTPEGKPIMAYPADGFTVVRGSSAQRERLDKKKLWNNYYYAFSEGDKGFRQNGAYFAWLERMGIFRSYGAYPGFEPVHRAKWELAKRRGLVFFGDSSGDSHWLNDNPEDGGKFVAALAPFTRFFKATNEIDIRREGDFRKLRDPEHWVRRVQWEYEAVHRARPDGHYVGGSLVRPGDSGDNQGYPAGLGPGKWFTEVLKLGLDKYQDAWDVHAYPRNPPRFGGPVGNGDGEDERGVLAAYAGLGRTNTLPFWLGEAGAKAAYGDTGRRWQAEQAAKMIAWANSRRDYLGIAFCIAHEYDLGFGRLWDYSMGHKPGEAALYTAGALIDGLPYRAADTHDADVQAAYFGDTFMIWRTDNKAGDWRLQLDASKPWVAVDVVGRAQPLAVGGDGAASVRISPSPVYVLAKADYERLTRR
jgi:hypothetical protein